MFKNVCKYNWFKKMLMFDLIYSHIYYWTLAISSEQSNVVRVLKYYSTMDAITEIDGSGIVMNLNGIFMFLNVCSAFELGLQVKITLKDIGKH